MSNGSWNAHKARVAADFGAAASGYDRAARLQRQVINLLLDSLPLSSVTPGTVLDLGCGTGLGIPGLTQRLPGADIVALDLAEGMLRHARTRESLGNDVVKAWIAGDAEALPLKGGSVDLVFSSLAIQWCQNPALVFDELARVLKPQGTIALSTLVEGTLGELKTAWTNVDPGRPHVNRFLSAATLQSEVKRVFPEAEVEIVPLRLIYPDLNALLRELKDLGARYKAAPNGNRITAPGKFRQLMKAYRALDDGSGGDESGRLPATYHVALIRGSQRRQDG